MTERRKSFVVGRPVLIKNHIPGVPTLHLNVDYEMFEFFNYVCHG